MREKTLSVTSFLTFILTSMTIIQAGAQQTTVYVLPASYTVRDIGLTFNLNITVQNVDDLYGWEFKLYYPNDILNGTSVTEGPFLKTGGVSTFFLKGTFTDNYNATHGLMRVLCTRVGEDVPGVNGSGTLATITFNSTSINGPEVLHLADVELSDSKDPSNKIPCTTVDGEVTVIPEFPIALILPLLILLTSLAIALKKWLGQRNTSSSTFSATMAAK